MEICQQIQKYYWKCDEYLVYYLCHAIYLRSFEELFAFSGELAGTNEAINPRCWVAPIDCSPRYPECNSHVTLQGSFTGYFESAITPPVDGCQGVSSLVVAWFPLQGFEIYMCYPCDLMHFGGKANPSQPSNQTVICW